MSLRSCLRQGAIVFLSPLAPLLFGSGGIPFPFPVFNSLALGVETCSSFRFMGSAGGLGFAVSGFGLGMGSRGRTPALREQLFLLDL